MYAKIQQPDGSWEIHEAKSIKYSDSLTMLNPQDGAQSPDFWGMAAAFIPSGIRKVLERNSIEPKNTLQVPFQTNLLPSMQNEGTLDGLPRVKVVWDYFQEHITGFVNMNVVFAESPPFEIPDSWNCIPLYSYVILDNTKAIVFPTKAYILNDDGKTIAKVG